jgi:hypothetical protein
LRRMIRRSLAVPAAALAIRPVRMLLIRARSGRRGGASGADGAGGAEPLGEGGGSVLVVRCGAGVAVMARLLPGWERGR